MNLEKSYRILIVNEKSSNEDIVKSFKSLAMKYHPDRNREKTEWANEQMSLLNSAYNFLMSFRFSKDYSEQEENEAQREKKNREKPAPKAKPKPKKNEFQDELSGLRDDARKDYLINRFANSKDDAKDALYNYFQYKLYNFHQRDRESNNRIYKRMTVTLRKTYHSIKKLAALTEDKELLEHFNIFSEMIFKFYKASECINIIDSYNDRYEVHAFRLYRKADEILNISEKELFYDRHNRGKFIRGNAVPGLIESEKLFREIIRVYPKSSWVVETGIKLEYSMMLRKYLNLFFS